MMKKDEESDMAQMRDLVVLMKGRHGPSDGIVRKVLTMDTLSLDLFLHFSIEQITTTNRQQL